MRKFFRTGIIKIIVLIDFFGVSLVVPLLSSYFRDAGIVSYGFISSIYFGSQLIGGIFIGFLSDYLRKKDILLLSFVGSIVSYCIVGFSSNAWLLLGSRVIVGLVKQTMTISTAIITELTDSDPIARSSELGHISALITAAFIIGPSVGGILYKYDKKLPALAASLCFVCNIILCIFFLPEKFTTHGNTENKNITNELNKSTNNTKETYYKKLKNILSIPNVGTVMILRLLTLFIETSMSSNNIINYYEERFGMKTYQRGFMTSLASVTSLIVEGLLVAPCLRTVGSESNMMIICTLFMAITSMIEYFVSSISLFLCFCLIPSVAMSSLFAAASKGLFTTVIPKEHIGKALGVFGTLTSGVGLLAPIYGSQIFTTFGGASKKGFIAASHFALLTCITALLFRDVNA